MTKPKKLSDPTHIQILTHIRIFDLERALSQEDEEVRDRLVPFCDALHDSAAKNLQEQNIRPLTSSETLALGGPGGK